MNRTKYIKLAALAIAVVIPNVLVLSPGFVGVELGANALSTAAAVTLLTASVLVLLYGSYVLLFKPPVAVSLSKIETHEDYIEALSRHKRIKVLGDDIALSLEQLDRLKKRNGTLLQVLGQRFDPSELSYKKFASVIQAVEKLFYLNIRSVLNRLNVFDEADFEKVMRYKPTAASQQLVQEKKAMYNEYLSFVKQALHTNEQILLKLDKLLLEISRLNSLEPGDIEGMPCMQEIDALIKQTQYYRQ